MPQLTKVRKLSQARSLRTLGVAGAIVFVTSEARFIAAKPICETTYPVKASPPEGTATTNLAYFEYGPTLRVSSINFFARHHSGYLIDGVSNSPEQKWMTDKSDRHPWLEVHFRAAHHLAAVRIVHAGAIEPSTYTAKTYTITCLRDRKTSDVKIVIDGNKESRPLHPLVCERATGIRIDFVLRGSEAVRLYEVEAVGLW